MLLADMRPGLYASVNTIADIETMIHDNEWSSPSVGLYLVLEIYEYGYMYVDLFATSVYPERRCRVSSDGEFPDLVPVTIAALPASRFLMAASRRINPHYADNLGRRVC